MSFCVSTMDVHVVSLHQSTDLSKIRSKLPGCTVRHHPAVDLRDADALQLYRDGMISLAAYQVVTHRAGRKWHWEFSTLGAVGLAQSWLQILRSHDSDRWLMICEDDVVFQESIQHLVKDAQALTSKFDIIAFGPLFTSGTRTYVDGTFFTADMFWGCHAVLIHPQSVEMLISILSMPLEMQIDCLFSVKSQTGEIRVLLCDHGAQQRVHASSIQTQCPLCSISGITGCFNYTIATLVTAVIAMCLFLMSAALHISI